MRTLIGIVVASVLMFVWGFIYWGILPVAGTVLKTMPNQESIVPVLESSIPSTGVYLIPVGADAGEPDAATQERHARGPIATLVYTKEGGPMMPPSTMVKGYLHMLGAAVVAAIILMASGRREYFGRLMICTWLGVFVAIWPELSRVIWFSFPRDYCVLYMTYHFTSCLLMGIVLAYFVKPAELEG
jgi:hypothetical protein